MKKTLSILSFILISAVMFAQNSFTVSIPNVVSIDEQFNVTFTVDGSGKPSDFNWDVSDDFQLVWGPQTGHSTSVQIINGKTTKSSQYTYTYILMPKSAGVFTLPKATVKIKGERYESNEPKIEVVGGGKASSGNSNNGSEGSTSRGNSSQISDDDIFLKFSIDRKRVVVGEPVIASIKLYQRVNIAGFEDAKFPSFNGFWSQEIEAPTNIDFQRESYNDQIYNTALLRKYILIPQKSGTLTIDPAELVCLVNVRVNGSNMGSIFDGFFDDYRTLRKRVVSPSFKVEVSPLPAGAPASFGGGVGKFNISAKVSRDSLKTHEAASLKITISGKGNVSLLEAPKVSFPPDFEVYDIKTTDNLDKNSGGTRGSKTYEYPFIPRSHGDFQMDPVQYSYYDVASHKYVTLTTDPIDIHVAKGAETESTEPSVMVSSGINRKGVSNLNEDIRFINVKKSGLSSKGSFFVFSGLYWGLIAFIVVAAAIVWFILRQLARRRGDVVGAKTRRATKMAMRRLKSAKSFLVQNLYGAFYEALHKAMIGYVSDKLNMSMLDLSKDNVSEALLTHGVDEETIGKYIAILDACEFARYSPDSGHEAMQAHYDEAVNVISIMDSNIKTTSSKGSGSKGSGAALLIAAILMIMPAVAGQSDVMAQDNAYADSLWNHAAQAYSEGKWQDAVKTYTDISNLGLESASLYCNIGSAYFKDRNYPYAILYFEKALKLDPSYSDARFNLEVAQQYVQDRIDVVPEFILKKWARDFCYALDSDSWAILSIIFFVIFAAMLLLFLLGRGRAARQSGFFVGIIVLLMAVTSVTFSSWQKNDYMTMDTAIVTRAVVNVKSSPSTEASTDLFVLHEGTKVKIIDNVGQWTNIELSDGRQGWIRESDMAII